jgi:hypothetical protein
MFIQVIQAEVSDEAGLRRSMDRWRAEVMPGAVGFLGSTAGVTSDGKVIVLARFESEEAARANSERPEQGAWFAETEKHFTGEASFMDCTDVQEFLSGGSDDAGFVQIMTGRSDDVPRMHEMFTRHTDELRQARPEVIGGLLLDCGDGRYVDAIYFTSETAARDGEQQEPPDDVRADLDEGMRMMGDITYLDLRDPILLSP